MRTIERKELDWHLGDIEQRFGFRGGKYTDVNTWFALLVTALLAGGLFIGLCHVPTNVREHPAVAIILARGWTPYAMVALFILSMVILFVKWRKLAFQKKAFKVELIPVGASFALTQETALDVLKRLNAAVDEPKRFVLFSRIERALLNLKNVGNVSDVSEMLRASAENDENHVDSSYGLLSGIIWVIPILGFIGTVIGLSGAIGGFGAALNAEASAASLKESLMPVTGSLSIAFDTTFVALVLAMIVQMAMTLLRRQEDLFLDACRDYAHGNIVSRLKLEKAG
ncbi:MAG: MotA/TolQ/ExbB proton channel family protein [Kiritimatiellae bacterium]|nr:MotA/TolQ/ExbB proton channel family protein [Kiritimatiellia bacterium]